MIAEAVRRTALADYAQRFTALYEESSGAIALREIPFVTQFNLRADAKDTTVMQGLHESLGLSLPLVPNTVSILDARRLLWLGPDEWLVVAPEGQRLTIQQALQAGLGAADRSIVDVSANRTVLQVGGPGSGDLLAHGVSIDLHPRRFAAGRCAQTLLAKAQVVIERLGEDPIFRLYVRASFACYVADWLLDAASGQ